ncbi:AMSH-like ubiquitin thioesterase 2 isoform X3 [Durio zibethinus]|uniref:AMSH-like ubiquitin thioesterase 2 isoform X3 n=1 Tax=Durio zibethinus TaxID=66656 RepID=A0A6P6BG91_DURZI|nr:AMSH-like ubiquitin thioesterase 2 isoform X3 [Durio zibethinus]
MYQFVDGREILKPLAIQDSKSQKIYAPLSISEKKDRSCGIAQTESQSSLRIVIEERVGWASCKELDTASSCSGHESPCPVPDQTTTACKHIKVLSPYNEPEASRVLQNVHISARLMEDFLELAKDNTEKDLETCGVLGAFLEQGTFYVTTLIIPKQESTSNSCQAINEEEIFAIQNERSLFPVGWIHTHPSQSCFMSSIDLHTQYSYQVMVPEAFAIVVAPTDNSRSYGIFRVSDPSGMSVLKECEEKGSQFHSHKETVNGSPIYEHCTHVYKNSNLRFEIFDLR